MCLHTLLTCDCYGHSRGIPLWSERSNKDKLSERYVFKGVFNNYVDKKRGVTVRQAVGEVQSLELHQYNIAMVLSTNLIKNKVFMHY
jgi:hypothetical protein